MKWLEFRPDVALRALARHEVDFVVIGGYGAALHGSPALTNDADICPDWQHDNLVRLAAALREIGALIYSDAVPEGLPFDCSAQFFENVAMANLISEAGRLDVSRHPAGSDGYPTLIKHAVTFEVGGARVKVASLDDIIHSKRTANRPKDHATLPILEALRDEIDAQGA
ncbi:MAG TPA: hypothetical protein VNQ73_21860 [Ilumatobacter sp.]|nr:hypothetical protein [Ilumatobacter sp.]